MVDNIKESLSALIDQEASEIEVHRLLRSVERDASLKTSWLRYQQIRSVIRQEQRLPIEAHLELNQRINAVIEAESPFADETGRKQRYAAVKLLKPVGGLAVAASLVAAIFMGFQTTQLVDSGAQQPIDIATGPAEPAQTVADAAIFSELADTPLNTTFASNGSDDEFELRELDEEKKKRLRAYLMRHDRLLMRHDRLSKMNPYARVSNTKKK